MCKTLILLCLFPLLAGCATMNSLNGVRESSDKRVVKEIFPYSKDKVFKAAKIAIADAGLGIQMANEAEGKIYAKSALKMTQFMWTQTGYGEYVGIYITPIENNKTQVEVVIQKSYLLDVGYTDYRNIIMNNIRTQLAAQFQDPDMGKDKMRLEYEKLNLERQKMGLPPIEIPEHLKESPLIVVEKTTAETTTVSMEQQVQPQEMPVAVIGREQKEGSKSLEDRGEDRKQKNLNRRSKRR